MVRLSTLDKDERTSLEQLTCPVYPDRPWVSGPPLGERRIAMVSTAGLMLRGERPVPAADNRYRRIPDDAPAGDILMAHVSLGFDRTGFEQDLNVVLPRERLHELADVGEIGSVAATHYSFMGATSPEEMEPYARRLAGELRADRVDGLLLIPV